MMVWVSWSSFTALASGFDDGVNEIESSKENRPEDKKEDVEDVQRIQSEQNKSSRKYCPPINKIQFIVQFI